MTDTQKFLLKLTTRVFMVVTLVLVARWTFFDEQNTNIQAGPPPLPILASIAPRYTMYLDSSDCDSLEKNTSDEYVVVQKSNTQVTLLAKVEGNGVWTSTVIINPQTLTGTIQEEYQGRLTSGVVKLTPDQFGGFDFKFTYLGESKSHHATLKPIWWE